jgi:hypothetical protein
MGPGFRVRKKLAKENGLRLETGMSYTKNGGVVQKGIVGVAALLIFLCAVIGNVCAYTYTYSNKTGHLIKVIVQLYDDADKTGQIEANESYTVSTKSLLKSWIAEVFLENRWQEILNMTCDLLPGNQTFSIYVDEVKDGNGIVKRTWNALNK